MDPDILDGAIRTWPLVDDRRSLARASRLQADASGAILAFVAVEAAASQHAVAEDVGGSSRRRDSVIGSRRAGPPSVSDAGIAASTGSGGKSYPIAGLPRSRHN